jgi:hypothetical protein
MIWHRGIATGRFFVLIPTASDYIVQRILRLFAGICTSLWNPYEIALGQPRIEKTKIKFMYLIMVVEKLHAPKIGCPRTVVTFPLELY